ncbi:MAG TPA: FHA domain-containing protein [Anaeromyxobacteraceae bacterium]|nr:FHA domain-containing protein [Anaeromyxobacteraceae bacterium]
MSKTVKCSRCGRVNDASFAFCLDCGQPLREAAVAAAKPACEGCGRPLEPGFRFCGHCGRPVDAAPVAPQPPTPGTATAIPAAKAPPPPDAVHAPGAPHAPPPGEARTPASGLRLVAVRPDGVAGQVHPLDRAELVCGRTDGQIRVPEDGTVSPRHARFTFEGGWLRVEDVGSVNGTFIRIHEPHRVAIGDELRIGRQLLRLEPLPRPPAPEEGAVHAWGAPDPGCRLRLAQLLEGGGLGEIFPLAPGESQIGREAGDLVFPGDRYVSARHAKLDVGDAEVTVTDLGSSNGTFVKTSGPTPLRPGDQILIGAQLFRVEV